MAIVFCRADELTSAQLRALGSDDVLRVAAWTIVLAADGKSFWLERGGALFSVPRRGAARKLARTIEEQTS